MGLRNSILTASRGTAILNTIFDSYEPWAGDISTRDQGSLVSCNLSLVLQKILLCYPYCSASCPGLQTPPLDHREKFITALFILWHVSILWHVRTSMSPPYINYLYVIDVQVAFEDGTSTSYALASSQERGQMFIGPGVDVYKGQIVGIHQRPGDLALNVCKKKAATNIRSNKEQTGKSSSAAAISYPYEIHETI